MDNIIDTLHKPAYAIEITHNNDQKNCLFYLVLYLSFCSIFVVLLQKIFGVISSKSQRKGTSKVLLPAVLVTVL